MVKMKRMLQVWVGEKKYGEWPFDAVLDSFEVEIPLNFHTIIKDEKEKIIVNDKVFGTELKLKYCKIKD